MAYASSPSASSRSHAGDKGLNTLVSDWSDLRTQHTSHSAPHLKYIAPREGSIFPSTQACLFIPLPTYYLTNYSPAMPGPT